MLAAIGSFKPEAGDHCMLNDDFEIDARDLASDEIQELLLETGGEINAEQAALLAALIAEMGSLEEALHTIAQLSVRENAA
jgi:hypothetical protein